MEKPRQIESDRDGSVVDRSRASGPKGRQQDASCAVRKKITGYATLVLLWLVASLGAGGEALAQDRLLGEPEPTRDMPRGPGWEAPARSPLDGRPYDKQRVIDQRRAVSEYERLVMRDPKLRRDHLQSLSEQRAKERRDGVERATARLGQPSKSRAQGLVAGAFAGCASQVEIPVAECEALVAIYNETDGPNWFDHTGWLETDSPCTWFGITCTAGTVTGFDATAELCFEGEDEEFCFETGTGLHGPFPAAFGDLTGLEVLVLSFNGLEGPIPAELGGLANLRELNLSVNLLEGSIPVALTQLGALEVLDLSENWSLGGSIPGELGNLANLKELALSYSGWEGEIPAELGNLSSLEVLLLFGNNLTGPIPPQLGNLANLRVLSLGGNSLDGMLPAELGQLGSLEFASFASNAFSGVAPGFTAGLSALQELYLYANAFETTIQPQPGELPSLRQLAIGSNPTTSLPTELGNLTNLEYLSISGLPVQTLPDLSGLTSLRYLYASDLAEIYSPIPDWMGSLPNLELLELGFSTFTGSIPAAIGNLSALQELHAEFNLLDGELPVELGNLVSLRRLQLNHNRLEGPLPTSIGNLIQLEQIILQGNALSGPIPAELGNLVHLEELALWENQLEGEIPAELGNLSSLTNLSLFRNQLSGEIPDSLGGLHTLEELSLNDNRLVGSFPAFVIALPNLRTLRLSGNLLHGPIPSDLGNLPLSWLELGRNQFTGSIPPELGNLPLWRLDLSGNQLTGPIPSQLGNAISMAQLVLRDNDLTGPIPPELGNLGQNGDFEVLDLGGNALSGPIPPELAQPFANSFQCWFGCQLDLSNNQLTGGIPASFGNIPFDADVLGRAVFRLAGNELGGQVPFPVAVQGASFEQRFGVQGLLEVLTGAAAGPYGAVGAAFGPPLTEAGLSATAVLADDGAGGDLNDACEPLVNGGTVAGNIAVINRGSCSFVTKVRHAQEAGAIAVVVVNIFGDSFPMSDDGTGADIVIPSAMISLEEGQQIRPTLPAAVTLSGTLVLENACDFSNNDESLFVPDSPEYAALTGEFPYICNLPLVAPLLVEYESVTAQATPQGVLLRWTTTTEIDTIGFRILRESGTPEKALRVIAPLIPSAGTGFEGASYEFLDNARQPLDNVRYYLEDIDTFGRSTRYGPIAVTPAAPPRAREAR